MTSAVQPRFLYELDLDCPIPWPAMPSYPIDDERKTMADSCDDGHVANQPAGPSKQEAEPLALKDAYWLCLYSKENNAGPRAFTRLFDALGSFGSDVHEKRQAIQSLLTQAQDLDEKWHTAVVESVQQWKQQGQSTFQINDMLQPNGHSSSPNMHHDTTTQREHPTQSVIPDTLDGVCQDEPLHMGTAKYLSTDEIQHLQRAYTDWHLRNVPAQQPRPDALYNEDSAQLPRYSCPRKGKQREVVDVREWMTGLEVAELELQVLLALELLSILPAAEPSKRLKRGYAGGWFASMRTAAGKKRKAGKSSKTKDSDNADDNAASSSIINEEMRLEELYRSTATLLDQLTDSLAIHQAVGGAGLFSLDLGGVGGSTEVAAAEESDKFQRFWTDVCAARYIDRLPSDMLSGCQSKFYTASTLQGSLFASSSGDGVPISMHGGVVEQPSPFHHPTPDLRALAQSVQLAEQARKDRMIPQSPTLAKLMAATTTRTRAPVAEDVDSTADWLMPPPSAAATADNMTLNHRRVIARSRSAITHTDANTGTGKLQSLNKNPFRAREVEIGAGAQRSKAKLVNGRTGSDGVKNGGNVVKPFSSSSTLMQASLAEKQRRERLDQQGDRERVNKRKACSPKRSGSSNDRRTLVLATPSKSSLLRESIQGTRNGVMSESQHTSRPVPPRSASRAAYSGADRNADDEDDLALLRTLDPTPRAQRVQHMQHTGGSGILAAETPQSVQRMYDFDKYDFDGGMEGMGRLHGMERVSRILVPETPDHG